MARPRPSDQARDFFTTIARAKQPDPIYYLHGEETYLLDRAVEQITKTALPDGPNDFNYQVLTGKETTAEQLAEAVEALPFMCRRRLVVVRDVQEMDMKILATLEGYFDEPNPTTCLVLHAVTGDKSLDGRQKIVKKLKKAATTFVFPAFYENEAAQFVAKQASQRQMCLDSGAVAHLTRAVGNSLQALDGALEKIDLFLGASESVRQVSAEDVDQIVADTRAHTIFDLTDALGDRRTQEALRVLEKMMLSGEAAIMINQMIARHFRIVAKLQDPSIRSADRKTAAKEVGVSPYFLKDYQRHAGKFSPRRVERILDRLLDVDAALKSSKLRDEVILEQLVLEILVER